VVRPDGCPTTGERSWSLSGAVVEGKRLLSFSALFHREVLSATCCDRGN
jgi:hypothetical protein